MKSIVPSFHISILFLFLTFFHIPSSWACTCGCENVANTLCTILNREPDLLVLQALVYEVREAPTGADDYFVEVLDRINNISTPDSIKVVIRSTCHEPLFAFDGGPQFAVPGDTVIMVVQPIIAKPTDTIAPYARYSCASSDLYQVDGFVEGWINDATRFLPYASFKDYVNSDLSQDLNCDYCNCACQNGGFIPPETFCGTIRFLSHWEHLIHGEVIAKEAEHGLKVKVEEVLMGDIAESEITIWGQIGSECRSPSNTFEIGSSYIFVLSDIELDEVRVPTESTDDYQLGSCGVNYLTVVNGEVQGAITALINEIDLQSLADWIDVAFDNVGNCLELETSLRESNETIAVDIFPNPTTGEINIQGPATQARDAQVRLYNTTGQLIFSTPLSHTANGKLDLSQFTQQKGLFFLEFATSEGTAVKKILLR